jgi:hypothetical protein
MYYGCIVGNYYTEMDLMREAEAVTTAGLPDQGSDGGKG